MLWWKDEINPWEYKNYNIENKFYTEYCFQIDFYRLKSERGGGATLQEQVKVIF